MPEQFAICRCQHCDNRIEFDASDFEKGETRTAECPHCNLETIIFVPEQTLPPVIFNNREESHLSKPPADFGRLGEDEEIIQQCIEVIRKKNEASASLLNKELRLGYNRAAQILNWQDAELLAHSNTRTRQGIS